MGAEDWLSIILLIDDNGLSQLREFTDAKSITPQPPLENIPNFQLNEEVDAFYNKWWWHGVISKVLDEDRYCVSLSMTKEVVKFGQSELRTLEGMNGTWIRSQDRSLLFDLTKPSEEMKQFQEACR